MRMAHTNVREDDEVLLIECGVAGDKDFDGTALASEAFCPALALVTLPLGVVAGVRLSPDYPRGNAKGAVVLESLTGVENWRDSDLAKAKERLNGGATVQWESLDGLFDAVEKELMAKFTPSEED